MGYCYFCESEHLGYLSMEYFCEDCKKLQALCKAVGVEKITQAIRVKFDKEKTSGVQTRSSTKKEKEVSEV